MIINGNQEYKSDEFVHFVKEETGEVKVIDTTRGRKPYRKADIIEIEFEDFMKVNMETKGGSVPYSNKNVVNMSRYMLWFWTPIIGSGAVSLYTLLTEYCDETTNICFPKVTDLAKRLGVSRPTVNKYMKTLSNNNFILVVNRLNKKADMKETSPLFKVRQTTPLLSSEQIEILPDILKKKHEDFMNRFFHDDSPKLDEPYSAGIDDLLNMGEVYYSKRSKRVMSEALEINLKYESLVDRMTEREKEYQRRFHSELSKSWSEVSYNAYLDNMVVKYDSYNERWVIIGTEFAKSIIQSANNISDLLLCLERAVGKGRIDRYIFLTFNEYRRR